MYRVRKVENMNEAIMEVLNNKSLDTNESRAEALKKALATLVVPKDKFNDLSKRLQNVEAEKNVLQTNNSDLQSKYDELRTKNMTADEKAKEELEQLKKDKEMVARQLSEIAVEKILAQNNISIENYGEEEYKNLVNDLISDTVDNSSIKANNFIKIFNKQKEIVEKETTSNLLKNTPAPNTGTDDNVITKEDFDKMTYTQMLDFMKENPELYKEYTK